MRYASFAIALFTTVCLSAATFDLPTDAELLGRANLVVVATVLDSAPREVADGMILTDHRLQIEQVLKGNAGGTIVVSEAGGFLNGRGVAIAGSATYEQGTRVLAFLRQRPDGTYYTTLMALGKYRFDRRGDRQVLVRTADGIETLSGDPADARDAQTFLDAIRGGKPARAPRVVANVQRDVKPVTDAVASAYVFTSPGGDPLRWKNGGSISFLFHSIQGGSVNSANGMNAAFAAWTNHPNSSVSLSASQAGPPQQTNHDNDDIDDIILGWNGDNPHSSCEGAKGCGIVYYNGPPFTHLLRGETFYDVESADVLVHQSITTQTSFDSILTHELGHALAFRHSNAGTPSSTDAIMLNTVPTDRGASLGSWDQEALTAVYGPGVSCTPVTISSTAGGGTVEFGAQRQLSVSVTGDSPRTYQWYEGTSGNTSTPVGTNSSTFTTPAVTTARNYWVRVTANGCPPSQDSTTITVTPAPCTAPQITQEPASSRITSGATAQLTVAASGTATLSYQWYRATSVSDTSSPVGGNSSTFSTPALSSTTSYWVLVSNNCGSASSAVATVTVSANCVAPSITSTSPAVNLNAGQGATISVAAAGDAPFTYQWFAGESGVQTNPVAGATSASLAAGPFNNAGTFKFWARVQNACGVANSPAITVTVAPTCVTPTIAQSSGNVSVQLGQGATISVTPTGGAPYTYQWFQGASGDPSRPIAGANGPSYAAGPFNAAGSYGFWVLVKNACNQQVGSNTITITVACPSGSPLLSAPALTSYASAYNVSWVGVPGSTSYELQESTSANFTTGVQTLAAGNALFFTIPAHSEITIDTRFYYRVRGFSSCTNAPTAWSLVASTVVTAPLPATSPQFAVSVPEGATQPFVQNYLVPGFGPTATNSDTFSITDDATWLTVFPPSGALSAGGTTVQFTINPAGLGIGSRTATILVTRTNGTAVGRVATHDNTTSTSSITFGLSLVTPVSPDPRDGNLPAGTLIIPAVAHAQGIGSPFRSDVRIVNVSFDDIEYEISFTPSGVDGTAESKKTTLTIRAGDTLAFDDILSSWFGAGMLGESGLGTLEIRPPASANPLSTFASSRTYALVDGGTLGQYIPALRAEQFVGSIAKDPLNRISLQQVANSSSYRTNVGFVEGSGSPVSILARLLDGSNNVLAQATRDLPPFGQTQSNLTALFGNVPLADGRVEVEVTSSGGKVSAYASVLNNNTNDPLMIFPVQPARSTANRYVLAGIAEFAAGDRNFHSDMRIYNGGSSPVTAQLQYYERGQSTPLAGTSPVLVELAPGQVRAINDVLPTLWNLNLNGGSVVATAPSESSLVLTAQTFSREADGGTKGQFIPGVTAANAVGFRERGLEVLQLEQSPQYRSNVGFVEVTGKPVVIEITAVEPDTKASVVTSLSLLANEYRQFDRILEQMGLGTVYNGRVNVKVITGEGRVYAYGSMVDNRTEDPTYVPGQ